MCKQSLQLLTTPEFDGLTTNVLKTWSNWSVELVEFGTGKETGLIETGFMVTYGPE